MSIAGNTISYEGISETMGTDLPHGATISNRELLSSLSEINSDAVEQAVLKFPPHLKKWSTFEIPKRSGKPRTITAPKQKLKEIQGLLAHLVSATQNFPMEVHGFVPHKGVKSAAEAVTAWLTTIPDNRKAKLKYVSLDMKDFFNTCKSSKVRNAYRKMFPNWSRKAVEKASWLSSRHCSLPQGSPVSPILTNVLARELDRQLKLIAKARKGIYIRYADDIFMIVENVNDIETTIKKAIESNEFELNEVKTRIGRICSQSGFELLGLRIHATGKTVKCTPRRSVRRKLRAAAMLPRIDKFDSKRGKCIILGSMHYHLGHSFGMRLVLHRGSSLTVEKSILRTGVTDTKRLKESLH